MIPQQQEIQYNVMPQQGMQQLNQQGMQNNASSQQNM